MMRAALHPTIALRFDPFGVYDRETLFCSTLPSIGGNFRPLPDPIGFAGPFAGTSGGALIVAGGANFPDKMPWEGGRKVWYDTAFVLDRTNGQWRSALKLPRPLGYGVSVTTPDGVLCIGGSDATQHVRDVFLLRWRAGELKCSAAAAAAATAGQFLRRARGPHRLCRRRHLDARCDQRDEEFLGSRPPSTRCGLARARALAGPGAHAVGGGLRGRLLLRCRRHGPRARTRTATRCEPT